MSLVVDAQRGFRILTHIAMRSNSAPESQTSSSGSLPFDQIATHSLHFTAGMVIFGLICDLVVLDSPAPKAIEPNHFTDMWC